MLAKITLYDGTVYKIASATTDTQDGIYLGRIKDELQLVSQMQEAGNAPTTVNLTIINHDNFIPRTKDLWAAELLLTNDNNVSWRGKINFCNFDADGNLYVTASEKTAPELELQLPDEVRQVYTVDEDFHQSSVTMTIPLVVGGSTSNPITLSTILIDKTRGIYLICVGEIRSIVKVYNGTEELPNTAYTAYTGTANQEENAGFAYVQIAEDYRLNSDGSYAEINVDVVGLKLGNHTEAECRNGARFLYYFLTTAATGVNGWGCGIDSNLIDSNSFNSAITLCDQLGYKLDGIMWLRQSAQSWIDQICQAIHGKYSINANGKRSLFIDYAGNASKKTFTSSNMRVEKYGKNSYTSVVYNKGILSYDYNPITGLFMQSAQYENAESIAQIGEQKFVGESYLIKDSATALAVLEYTCKRSQSAAEAIEFVTDDISTNLKAGDIITINRPDLSLNNALYQVQNISITDFQASITAQKFDTSVFSVTGTASSVNWGNEKQITPALTPAQATNLLLSTGFDINPDGTGTPYISGTFTVPAGGWLAAAVQYGIGASPSNWTELALITDGRFKISPVNVGTVYSVRVRMITATGHSSFITGVITATGDTTPPLAPTIAANATDKTVTVKCGLDNPPYDMGGFQIYRKKSTEADSAYTLIAMVAANRGYASYSDYVSEYITYNYKAKSYDRSGNLSTNFSNTASVTVTGIQANDVAATALAMPTGSILRLSAKNCTTASIAEANGVKDVSGNGNHGKASGGVSILDGGEGFCFNKNRSEKIECPALSSVINGGTIIFRHRNKGASMSSDGWNIPVNGNLSVAYSQAGTLRFNLRNNNGNNKYKLDIDNTNFAEIGVWHQFAGVVSKNNDGNFVLEIYVDAVKIGEGTSDLTGSLDVGMIYTFGGLGYGSYFDLADIRIYPRALSASEIKTLYMFPDDVTFGQLTADLIGANVIKASNLVYTENIITQTAQIKDAIITNAKISDLNASKINAGTLDAARIAANAITAEKLSVTAINFPYGASMNLCFDGCTTASVKLTNGVINIGNRTAGIGNGTASNGCTISNNSRGLGLYFNGSSYVTLPNPLGSSPSNFTIYLRFYLASVSSGANQTIFCCRSELGKGYTLFIMGNTNIRLDFGDQYPISKTIAGNAWHDVIVTRNSSAFRICIDGTWTNAGGVGSATGIGSARLFLGASHVSQSSIDNYLKNNSCLKHFAVWDRVLTEGECNYLLANGMDTESGQITADRIAAGSIETRHLTADAIVGKTFQTASNTGTSNAAGVRFNSSGIQGFNGSAKTFDLSTNGKLTCSDVDLTGKITATSGSFGNWSLSNDYFVCNNTNKDDASLQINHQDSNYNYSKLTSTKLEIKLTASSDCVKATYSYSMLHIISYQDTSESKMRNASYIYAGNCLFERYNTSGSLTNSVAINPIYTSSSTPSSNTIYIRNGAGYASAGWASGCDESIKREIKDVTTLEKLKTIRVKKYKYSQKALLEKAWQKEQALKAEENLKKGIKTEEEKMPEFKDDENSPDYIMAMAGEFNKAFGVDNGNEEEINYTNAIGVALRAIQELAAEVDELKAKLKIQQDEKSDVEQEASYTEKSDNSKDADNLDFPDVGKNGENQQEEQKK